MFNRSSELLEGDNGRLSASNLGFLLAVVTLCVCTILAAISKDVTALLGIAGILAGQTGATKVMNKLSEASVQRASMNPAPPAAQPILPLGPTTIINAGGEPKA